MHAGIPPPQSRHLPEADTLQKQTPPRSRHPPEADTPSATEHAGTYGQQVGGMHRTGM